MPPNPRIIICGLGKPGEQGALCLAAMQVACLQSCIDGRNLGMQIAGGSSGRGKYDGP